MRASAKAAQQCAQGRRCSRVNDCAVVFLSGQLAASIAMHERQTAFAGCNIFAAPVSIGSRMQPEGVAPATCLVLQISESWLQQSPAAAEYVSASELRMTHGGGLYLNTTRRVGRQPARCRCSLEPWSCLRARTECYLCCSGAEELLFLTLRQLLNLFL